MNRIAIVTGASRGIGYAIARQLGLDGYQVVITATGRQEKYTEALEALTKQGIRWHYVQGSINSAEDRQRLLKETLQHFGRVDVLVNNAGVAPLERRDILEMSEESFDRVIGINTKGTLFLTQLIANQMLKQKIVGQKRGTIINIGSCSAEVSSASRGEYCISKAGVAMITRLFADRLAPEGILVHEIRPGIIATDMTDKVKEKYDAIIENGAFPIKRWGMPQDVADAVSVFCSDKILYTTGSYLDIDGGFHIRRL